jgi:DNA polymerase III sliding clamp (beta) subunit (PCNA family)
VTIEFQVPLAEFVDALSDAKIAAGTDWTLPVLCTVQLAGDKGAESITLTGTDRYLLVQRVMQLDEPLANDIRASIPTDQVAILVSALKPNAAQRRGQAQTLTVAVDDGKLTAGNLTVALDVDHEFPKIQQLVEQGANAAAEISLLPVDLKLLARVGKLTAAKPRGTYARIYFTKGKEGQPEMLSVRFNDDGATRVLVMPARAER